MKPSATLALLSLAATGMAWAASARAAGPAPAASASAQCESAIAAAEREQRVPDRLLPAIGRVEAGRPDPRTGAIRPWPWTINVGGEGRFFETKEEAVAAVAALQAAGVRSIDVGCMQVNLMHHPNAFASLDEAFDPQANARYAARFLVALYRQTSDWPTAVAYYHSQTPELGEEYQRRVYGRTLTPLGQPLSRFAAAAAAPASPYGVWPPPGMAYAAVPPKDFAFRALQPPPVGVAAMRVAARGPKPGRRYALLARAGRGGTFLAP